MKEVQIKFLRDKGFVKAGTVQTVSAKQAESLIERGIVEVVANQSVKAKSPKIFKKSS